MEKLMIFKNSQQDIIFDERDAIKVVGLKVSGGADSALVAYMLSKYVVEERPDIKIIPVTTIHAEKPYQEIYAKRVIEFLKKEFGNIYGHHYINTAVDSEDYIPAQDRIWMEAYHAEGLQMNYTGITANPPKEVMDTFRDSGPSDDRNGKNFPITIKNSRRHLVNIDKKGVAELYESLDLMDTLFPITRSCEAFERWKTYDIDKHCGKCWWCEERYWGFNRYV